MADETPGSGGHIINSSGTASVLMLTPTGSTTFSGVIAGGGTLGTISLTLNGPGGTMVLTGPNTYTGSTLIAAGTLQLGDGTHDGSLATSGITNGGELVYNLLGTQTANYPISGLGSLVKFVLARSYLAAPTAIPARPTSTSARWRSATAVSCLRPARSA